MPIGSCAARKRLWPAAGAVSPPCCTTSAASCTASWMCRSAWWNALGAARRSSPGRSPRGKAGGMYNGMIAPLNR